MSLIFCMTVAMAAAGGGGVGFEVGKDRLLLARAASFVRMKGGVGLRMEKGEVSGSVVRD